MDEQVVWFDVPMGDFVEMEVSDGLSYLGEVVPRSLFGYRLALESVLIAVQNRS